MTNVLVIDSTGKDFGKHAYSQLKEFNLNVKVKEPDFLDVPGVLSRSNADSFIVVCDLSESFAKSVVDKILELEIEKGFIQKVLLDSTGESQEVFNKRAQRKSSEAAEKLAEKIDDDVLNDL